MWLTRTERHYACCKCRFEISFCVYIWFRYSKVNFKWNNNCIMSSYHYHFPSCGLPTGSLSFQAIKDTTQLHFRLLWTTWVSTETTGSPITCYESLDRKKMKFMTLNGWFCISVFPHGPNHCNTLPLWKHCVFRHCCCTAMKKHHWPFILYIRSGKNHSMPISLHQGVAPSLRRFQTVAEISFILRLFPTISRRKVKVNELNTKFDSWGTIWCKNRAFNAISPRTNEFKTVVRFRQVNELRYLLLDHRLYSTNSQWYCIMAVQQQQEQQAIRFCHSGRMLRWFWTIWKKHRWTINH